MATRGRKSAAALAVSPLAGVTGVDSVTHEKRLTAPGYLTQPERIEWAKVVNACPAGSFDSSHEAQLSAYCRHAVAVHALSDVIAGLNPKELAPDEYRAQLKDFLKLRAEESRLLSSHATRLRITRQASEHPETVANKRKKDGGAGARDPLAFTGE